MQNSFRFTKWNHLFYFLLQGIISILKCSRYFICSESIKMSIFAWYLVFVFFFFQGSMQNPIKIPTGSIQDKAIEYFTFSYIHGSWLFILWFHCGFCNKKGTFRVFTGFGHFQTSETSGRNMTVEFNRQTSGEFASLPQYLGCNAVFDMRLRVTFLRRKTVSLQSNIAHRE